MLWNYLLLEYCLYIGPECILCPLKWHFSWFCTHFYWSFQNFLYVSWWLGLPSRVLFHLFWILSTCLGELEWFFCIKLQHIPTPTVEIVLTGAGFCCLPEPKLRCPMFCLPLVPGGIYYPVWSTHQTSKFANTSYFCCGVLPPQMIRVFIDFQLSVLSAEDWTVFPYLLWLTLCASFFSMDSAEPFIAVTLVQTFY